MTSLTVNNCFPRYEAFLARETLQRSSKHLTNLPEGQAKAVFRGLACTVPQRVFWNQGDIAVGIEISMATNGYHTG